jgi:hypothetical protein
MATIELTAEQIAAIDTVLIVAQEVVDGETSRTTLRVALGQMKQIHGVESVARLATPAATDGGDRS